MAVLALLAKLAVVSALYSSSFGFCFRVISLPCCVVAPLGSVACVGLFCGAYLGLLFVRLWFWPLADFPMLVIGV